MVPIKAPWDGQYTEMLPSRPGYHFDIADGWLRIFQGDALVQIVSGSLVRSGMVDITHKPPSVELHVMEPEHAKVVERLATPQRRGRAPKMQ
jgi:hypothetical protein